MKKLTLLVGIVLVLLGLTMTEVHAEEPKDIHGTWQPVNSLWCVPASVATTLHAYGKQRKVREVAHAMGQDSLEDGNFDPNRAVSYLNGAEHRHIYRGLVATSLRSFKDKTRQVLKRNRPVITFVEMYDLPWYHDDPATYKGVYHAVTLTKMRAGRYRLWDPNMGWFWIKAPTLYSGMQDHYLPGYYIA